MSKLGLQTREERMTNLMKDIGKFDYYFGKKKKVRCIPHNTINFRWSKESQLGKSDEDIGGYFTSQWKKPFFFFFKKTQYTKV